MGDRQLLISLLQTSSSSSYSTTALLVWPWLPLIIDARSSLSNTFVLHRFTPSFLRSSSTLFIPLSLGRLLLLRPSNSPSKIFFIDLVSFILTTCPSHSNLRIFFTFTTGQLLILYFAFINYLRNNGNRLKQCIRYLKTRRKLMIQLGGRPYIK